MFISEGVTMSLRLRQKKRMARCGKVDSDLYCQSSVVSQGKQYRHALAYYTHFVFRLKSKYVYIEVYHRVLLGSFVNVKLIMLKVVHQRAA